MHPEIMRAVAIDRFGSPEQLSLREMPLSPPGPGEVRIHVAAAAVNPADLGMVAGTYRWSEPVRFPLIPGYDAAGRVDAVGEGVTTFAVGDQVIVCSQHSLTQIGTYADYVVLPQQYIAPAPAGIEPIVAASLPLAGLTALQALEHLSLASGQTLLVNGPLGAVGGFAVQLAARQGITVLAPAFARDAERARALGATLILDREKNLAQQVHQAVPSGVDAALDTVGGAVAMRTFTAVRDAGRYITIVPEFWIPGGQFTQQRGITPYVLRIRANVRQLTELSRLLETGQLTARIGEVLRLEQASEAHRIMANGHGYGKIILVP